MARAALQKVYADFRQGFVTVANPLAYPEGTLKDIVNFDIKDNGTLKLRAGLRQETATTISTGKTIIDINNLALSVHIWDDVNNIGGKQIAVIQVGSQLYFFDMLDSGIDLDNIIDQINIGIPSTGQDQRISATSGAGRLFIVHPSIKPKVLKLTDTGTVSSSSITLKIRDLSLWLGANDNETGYTRDSMHGAHEYNLANGGWPREEQICATGANPNNTPVSAVPVLHHFDSLGNWPSISIPFPAARQGSGDNIDKQISFSPWVIRNDYFGGSTVPLGKFIYDAEDYSRTGFGQEGSPSTFSSVRWTQFPSSVAFYSDRVWYTGAKGYEEYIKSPSSLPDADIDISGTLYFSQQLNNNLSRINKCYQENDPTAEDINQLLSTDGGTISIRGAGEILDIKPFGTALVIFSSEGLWAVSGIDGNSFTADSFSVNRISNIGPSSKETVAADNNSIYYIANDAIYILATNEVTGLPQPQDITSGKIKDFYTNLSTKQKENSRAFFDSNNRNLYVFYTDVPAGEEDVANLYYNKVLVFNQDLGAFYKYNITIDTRYVVDGLFYNKDQLVTVSEPITIDSEVVTIDGVAVTLDSSFSTSSLNGTQLLTIVDNLGNAEFTFSSFTDITDFKDWGQDYSAFVETGFDTAGDIMRDSLKAPVLISHMERTEDGFEVNPADPEGTELILTNRSSCLLSYGWDWATNYINQREIYRFNRNYVPSGSADPFDYGVDIITTRNRIRGKGHSLGVKLEAGLGKDCRVLGIGILYTVARDI